MSNEFISSPKKRKQIISHITERLQVNVRVLKKLFQRLPDGSRHIVVLGEGGILLGLLFITRWGFLWVVILSGVLLASIRLKPIEHALDQEEPEEHTDEIEEQIAEKESEL